MDIHQEAGGLGTPRKTLTTARLRLRPAQLSDAGWMTQHITRPQVQTMLTGPPYPMTEEMARSFLDDRGRRPHFYVIERQGAPLGVISYEDDMGYWLRPEAWGQGIISEAIQAVVDDLFAAGEQVLWSGYVTNNAASAAALGKAGFEPQHLKLVDHPFRGHRVAIRVMRLTHGAWAARRRLPQLTTARLHMRPCTLSDAPALARIGGDPAVAPMLVTPTVPWPVDAVRGLINGYWAWRWRPGFRLAMVRRGGPLIGTIGMSPTGDVFYFLDPAHWGRGYMAEALAQFLPAIATRFGLTHVTADAFNDNPASLRTLRRAGFEETGQGMGTSAARAEACPITEFRKAL